MTTQSPDELDELFHFCAFRAYLMISAEQQGWPNRESTRRLAFTLYEGELRRKDEALPSEDGQGSRLATSKTPIAA